jgi:PilZ domain
MKLGRGKAEESNMASELPSSSAGVTLVLARNTRIPARVLESAPSSLLVVIMVPINPLSPAQLAGMVLEFLGAKGRVRLTGTAVVENPSEPDVIRLADLRSIDVVQEREHVRIRSARRVVVYGGENLAQIDSFTLDISGGGFLMAGADLLHVGDEVQFQLELASGELPVCGTGKVVRVDPRGYRGIAFDRIKDLDQRRLVRYIFECQRAELRMGLGADDHHGS